MTDFEVYFENLAFAMRDIKGVVVNENREMDEDLRHDASVKDFLLIYSEGGSRFNTPYLDNRTEITEIQLQLVKQCKPGDKVGRRAVQQEAKIILLQILAKIHQDWENGIFNVFDINTARLDREVNYPEANVHGYKVTLEIGQSVNSETYYNENFFDAL